VTASDSDCVLLQ